MKSLKQNSILFLVLFCFFLLGKEHWLWTSLILCTSFWYLRTKDHSCVYVLILLMVAAFPLYSSTYPDFKQGRAVVVKNRYSILANGRERILVYTEEPFEYDATYRVEGTFQKIEEVSGFFRFDSLIWAHSMGAYYSTDSTQCSFVKQDATIRHWLQQKINAQPDLLQRQQMMHLLLNINTAQKDEPESFLDSHGFTYAGMIAICNLVMKYFLDRRKRNYASLGITILLILIYQTPMLLIQSFLFRICSFTKMNRGQRTAICLCLILLLYPGSLLTLGFLIPAIYRLSFLIPHNRKKTMYFIIVCLQSIFMHRINLIETVLYPVNLLIVGCLWWIGMLAVWIPWIPFARLCSLVDWCNSSAAIGNLYGSILGPGLLIYMICCFYFYHRKYAVEMCLVLLVLFQSTGLFHPLAEVTTINVGQGDSILIREPFNQQNVLIDTGKPAQWNALNDYLHAKGIGQIQTLVITHADNDHSGNMDAVIAQYHPEQIITSYQEKIQSHHLFFEDINTIQNSDENESSIVLAFQMNQLKYLFMGDADRITEEKIAEIYDGLKCDVLKLSHHGSKTGSCSLFLDTVQPKLGLISSGAYSIYHHPSPETIQALLKRHIPYLDTKESGDISILALPGLNLLITSAGNLGIIK